MPMTARHPEHGWIDATAADHVVLVRRRAGAALEATLVTRRSGVKQTTTILPASLLDDAAADEADESVGVAVGPGLEAPPDAPSQPRSAEPSLGSDAPMPAGSVCSTRSVQPLGPVGCSHW